MYGYVNDLAILAAHSELEKIESTLRYDHVGPIPEAMAAEAEWR